jgi:hypothetical protein
MANQDVISHSFLDSTSSIDVSWQVKEMKPLYQVLEGDKLLKDRASMVP